MLCNYLRQMPVLYLCDHHQSPGCRSLQNPCLNHAWAMMRNWKPFLQTGSCRPTGSETGACVQVLRGSENRLSWLSEQWAFKFLLLGTQCHQEDRFIRMAYQTFQQEYMQMPPITRAYTTACVFTTLAVVCVFFHSQLSTTSQQTNFVILCI